MTLDELLGLNPFPGLRAFLPREADRFFGRQRQVDELVARLEHATLIAVAGASGCGKSSLVLAGLLQALTLRRAAGGGTEWRPAVMRPGNHPISNLAESLSGALAGGAEGTGGDASRGAALAGRLRLSGIGLAEAVRLAHLPADVRVLVVVDQFEEIFRFRRLTDPEEAAAFVKLLLHAAQDTESPVNVVLTLRSDTLGYCADFRDLPEAISRGQYLVPRLTREQRKEAIVGPVELRGFRIAPRLVQRVLNDVSDDFDDLPVMQHALSRTWRRWATACAGLRPIDVEDYEAIGTADHALSLHADEAYLSLEGKSAVVEKVFRALTERVAEGAEVRRPMEFERLCAVTAADDAEVAEVVERYRAPDTVFLLPSPQVPLATNPVIDISHESLIRNWGRLKEWADKEAQSAQMYRRLTDAAGLFAAGSGGLQRDPALQVALDWRERNQPNAAWAAQYDPRFEQAMQYLDASRDAREQELVAARRAAATRRRFAGALAIVMLGIAIVIAWLAIETLATRQKVIELSEASQRVALARQLVAHANNDLDSGRLDRGLWLSVAAAKIEPREVFETLEWALQDAPRRFLRGHDARLSSVAFSPDGKSLASASMDGKVIRWDLATGTRLQLLEREANEDRRDSLVAFARDGSMIATPCVDGTAFTWSADAGARQVAVEGEYVGATVMAVDPERRTFASSSGDNMFSVWSMSNGKLLAAVAAPAQQLTGIAFSPDGRLLALGTSDRGVLLWDLTKGKAGIRSLKGHPDVVTNVAFSPDGTSLASGSRDGTVILWNVATGAPHFRLPQAHRDEVTRVAFSPDGTTLASAGKDYAVFMWDAATGKRRGSGFRRSHQDVVTALAFSPDGRTLASGSLDKSIILWNVAEGKPIGQPLKAHQDKVVDIAFSPDGNTLASAGWDNAVILWDVGANRPWLGPLASCCEGVTSVAFSPDGNTLAAANEDSNITVWRGPADVRGPLTLGGHTEQVTGVAFSPDGGLLASASEDQTVRLWNPATGEPQGMPLTGHKNKVTSVAFSPDGKTLASGSWDTTVILWDLGLRKPRLPPLAGHLYQVTSIAFSPDGTVLASASQDKTIRLWDTATGQAIGKPLEGHTGWVTSVAFSPDGKSLVSGGLDGEVKLWDIATARPRPGPRMGHTKGVWGVAFRRDGRAVASGGLDLVVKLWDVEKRTLIGQPFTGHGDSIWSVAFRADGKTLVSGSASAEKSVILWDADFENWPTRACVIAGRDIKPEEWPKNLDDSLKKGGACKKS